MALVNFTMPFGGMVNLQSWTTISPLHRQATAINNMLYGPVGHQQDSTNTDYDYNNYKNDPYAPPTTRNQQPPQQSHPPPHLQQPKYQQHQRHSNDYLPPPTPKRAQQTPRLKKPNINRSNNDGRPDPAFVPAFDHTIRSFESVGPPESQRNQILPQQPLQPPLKQPQYNNYNGNGLRVINYPVPISTVSEQPILTPSALNRHQSRHDILSSPNREHETDNGNADDLTANEEDEDTGGGRVTIGDDNGFPRQAATFTRVQAGTGSKTQVHAILDYDDDDGDGDEYYDDESDGQGGTHKMPTVTPIQGPIFLKNGSVPVVPLFSYPTMRNGSFVQIPIWWTALSVALGLEIRGEVIRGTPCVKRFNQLFCPTAGNSYPISRIEEFIDENKALMRRMYGDFEMSTQYGPPPASGKRKRATSEFASHLPPPGVPDFVGPPGSDMDEIPSPVVTGDSYFSNWRRTKRQSSGNFGRTNQRANNSTRQSSNAGPTPPNEPVTGRVDACESKIEIVTPYWASNSAGKIRAIVNTQHFEQAIHQEVCTKSQTGRCGGECGCEQKYKWHRLLAYDPDNDCRGIFMDWFLFPSCCVCRCNP